MDLVVRGRSQDQWEAGVTRQDQRGSGKEQRDLRRSQSHRAG